MEKQTNMEGKYADPGMAGQNGTVADGTGIRRYDGPSAGRAAGAAGKIAEGKAPGGAVRLSSAADGAVGAAQLAGSSPDRGR